MSAKSVKSNGDTYSVRRRGKGSLSAGVLRSRNSSVHPEQLFQDNTPAITPATSPIHSSNSTEFSLVNGMGNTNRVAEKAHDKDKSLYLSSDKVLDIIGYFNYSSIISHGLDDYFHGIIRGKLERKSAISYDGLLTYFTWFLFLRNLLLAFIEDVEIRSLLGETERLRPERQLVMVVTMWGIYSALVFLIYDNSTKYKYFTWLSPFQVLRGQTATKAYGLNTKMAEMWHSYTIYKWRKYLIVALIRSGLGIGFVIWVASQRWKTSTQLFKMMQVFWSVFMGLWAFFSSHVMYISYIYFRSLCYYFRSRYQKVNDDIESIITGSNRMKSSERIETLHHILIEHNELCLKIAEYNLFWAKWLMSTYFFLVTVMCFTLFQSLFTTNPILVRILMFLIAVESAYFLTTISISAALLSNTLRMFIQRLSGPTIGFYCLDLFEITYTTYASIVAALGQNFLLIVDFVRSYAEVGREEDDIPNALTHLTETVFNTTVSAMGLTAFTERTDSVGLMHQNTNL